MAFDTTRSYFNDLRERAVADGAAVTEEAQVLVYVNSGGGTLAVAPSAGAPGELVAGFAITDALKVVTRSVVEELVVPTGGGTVSLQNQSLVAASTRAFDLTAAAALILTAVAPVAGEYQPNLAQGTVTFDAAEQGNSVRLTYRYSPTLAELLATDHERSINNRAQDLFSQVSVGGLEGEIFTSMFDTSVAYAVGDPVISGAGGLCTTAAGGTLLGVVSQEPSTADGLLGVKFSSLT